MLDGPVPADQSEVMDSRPTQPSPDRDQPLSGGDGADGGRDLPLMARRMLRRADRAALATLQGDNPRPYVSLVGIATDTDGAPLLLLSRLAEHTRALMASPLASLLIDGTAGFVNPQEGPRLSLQGRILPIDCDHALRRFLARHPGAALYAGFADFSVHRMTVERIHWVGGFGRARWFAPVPALEGEARDLWEKAEPGIIAAVNDERDGMRAALAARNGGGRGKLWTLVAVDPDGCDLARAGRPGGGGKSGVVRVAFPVPLSDPDKVIPTLGELAGL